MQGSITAEEYSFGIWEYAWATTGEYRYIGEATGASIKGGGGGGGGGGRLKTGRDPLMPAHLDKNTINDHPVTQGSRCANWIKDSFDY